MSLYIVNLINHFSVDLALEYFSMIRRVGRDAPLYMSHNMSHKASLMSLYIVNLINHFPAGLALKYFSMISAGLALEYALWELVPSWYKTFASDHLGLGGNDSANKNECKNNYSIILCGGSDPGTFDI